MGEITVTIGGRGYPLACRDGEEAHLSSLAGHLQAKADELQGALGAMSEPRLLLMAGILIADELFEQRKGNTPPPPDLSRFEVLAARLEAIAKTLDRAAGP